jgi:toxin ParE1/3/4
VSPRKRALRVELTRRALADLRDIERFSVNEWGRANADEYLDGIAAALDRLREEPEILRLERDLAPGLFFYRVKKHFLVCDYQDETVIVLTVIHTSMDLPARLSELEPRLVAEARLLRSRLHGRSSED